MPIIYDETPNLAWRKRWEPWHRFFDQFADFRSDTYDPEGVRELTLWVLNDIPADRRSPVSDHIMLAHDWMRSKSHTTALRHAVTAHAYAGGDLEQVIARAMLLLNPTL